jgi:hypothetical protein
MKLVPRNDFVLARKPTVMLAPLATTPGTVAQSLPGDVDPVLVGIITVLLLIVFAFFLLIRRTLLSFSEGIREGRR